MSETVTQDQVEDQAGLPVDDEETIAAAKRMGWRGPEEFKGDPSKFVGAKQFLENGFQNPVILAERYKVLDYRTERMERELTETRKALESTRGQLDGVAPALEQMTKAYRSAEQRAYERARRELAEQREKAVEVGDTATFRRLDAEMQELDRSAPAAAPPPPPAPPPAAPAAPGAPPPEVQEFFGRNPWYTTDPVLRGAADVIFNTLGGPAKNGADLRQVLTDVESQMRTRFNVGGAAAQPRPSAASVDPTSSGAEPRRQRGRFTFEAMPQQSKDAYDRYSRALGEKGHKLTKEEWARDYWADEIAAEQGN